MFKWIGTALLAGSMFAMVGCNGGGVEEEPATFTISAEQKSLKVQAGTKKVMAQAGKEEEITVSIDRGEGFDQTVTVEVKPPEGITVDPETVELQSGQEEAKVTLKASSDAAVGEEKVVELTFTPETGDSITKQLTVMVVEQQQSGDSPEGSDQGGGQ